MIICETCGTLGDEGTFRFPVLVAMPMSGECDILRDGGDSCRSSSCGRDIGSSLLAPTGLIFLPLLSFEFVSFSLSRFDSLMTRSLSFSHDCSRDFSRFEACRQNKNSPIIFSCSN